MLPCEQSPLVPGFIPILFHEAPLQLTPSFYLNPLSCIVHLCSLLYYFTLPNTRRFLKLVKGGALTGAQSVAEILVGRGGSRPPPPSRKIDKFSEILT
jgi:hypothetical protein